MSVRFSFLKLDRYMSGNFTPIFLWSLGLSALIFCVLWGFAMIVTDWSAGDAFMQMSNPFVKEPDARQPDLWEWLAIVVFNLFGLFVLNGIILTLLVNWVSNRRERHEKGEARYENIFKSRYAVIIGGHKIVASLARDLISKPDIDYVLIQTQREPALVRKEITAEVDNRKTLHNIVIYSGDRTSWHELEELHLDKAKEIYIIGETRDIDRSSHDAINMQTWEIINQHLSTPPSEEKRQRVPCHIMFEYQSTFKAFQITDLKLQDSRLFSFIPFSLYENWAQQVLISNIKDHDGEPFYLPLDGKEGISYDSPERVHLIIIGMSKMGTSMAYEATQVAHYPNFNNPGMGRPRTLITFIDRNARREMLFTMGRSRNLFKLARWRFVEAPEEIFPTSEEPWQIYDSSSRIEKNENKIYPWNDPLTDPDLHSPYYGGYLGEDFIDTDFEFIQGDIALPSIQKYLSDACGDKKSKTTIAVCFPIAVETMSTALYFEPSVYEDAQQIWVYQPESGALTEAIRYGLTGRGYEKYRKLRPFGMIEKCDYFERMNSVMPKLVAYAYACLSADGYSSFAEKYFKSRSVSEFIAEVDRYWKDITQEDGKSAVAKKWSNIYCANSFPIKVRSMSIDIDKEGVLEDLGIIMKLAETEHNRWVMEQLLMGFGPVDKNYSGKLPVEDREERNRLKSMNIAPDLISNSRLGKTQAYDMEIVKIIPLAFQIAKKWELNNQKNNDDEKDIH